MATPYIMPLGFIDRTTDDGAVMLLTNPEDSLGLRLGTPITVWPYSQEHLALAKLRGNITAVGHTTATFTTSESQTDPRWPEHQPILAPAAPVLMALKESFDPDPARKVTSEKAEAVKGGGRIVYHRRDDRGPYGRWNGDRLGAREDSVGVS